MEEEWRAIKGYEDRYLISNLGRVMGVLRRVVMTRYGKEYVTWRKPKVLSGRRDTKGYVQFTLCDGQDRAFLAHRLVAEAFLSNPDNLPEVNHKNLQPRDNRVDNLEWVSKHGNMRHASESGAFDPLIHRSVKLSWKQVEDIRWLNLLGFTKIETGRIFGVDPKTIAAIVFNRTWKVHDKDLGLQETANQS